MNVTKTTKFILAFLFILLLFVCLYLGYKYFIYPKPKDQNGLSKVKISGTIKKGSEITPQKDYCPDELYIVNEDKTYQLRTPDNLNERPTVVYAKYRGQKVEINADLNNLQPNCNGTINCGCDQFILVNNVKVLEKTMTNFENFSGTITCLPLKDGGSPVEICALGLKTNDNKYYMLKNIEDSKMVEGTNIELTGDIEIFKAKSPYKIDAILNVVEVK